MPVHRPPHIAKRLMRCKLTIPKQGRYQVSGQVYSLDVYVCVEWSYSYWPNWYSNSKSGHTKLSRAEEPRALPIISLGQLRVLRLCTAKAS